MTIKSKAPHADLSDVGKISAVRGDITSESSNGGIEEQSGGRSDNQLMAGMAAGNTALLGVLYSRYNKMVKAALYYWAPEMTQADIEDVCQEVFIALGKTAANYKDISSFRAWLYRITSHKAISWRRKAIVRKRLTEKFALFQRKNTRQMEHPSDTTSDKRQAVRQMLANLPDVQRQALWLHFVEGYDGDEIAKVTGVRRATVYTRLYRARQVLLENDNAYLWKSALDEDES